MMIRQASLFSQYFVAHYSVFKGYYSDPITCFLFDPDSENKPSAP